MLNDVIKIMGGATVGDHHVGLSRVKVLVTCCAVY
jgi:hypothetical protein